MVRALSKVVVVGGQVWYPGDVPPENVASQILNPACWSDGIGSSEPVPTSPAALLAMEPYTPEPSDAQLPFVPLQPTASAAATEPDENETVGDEDPEETEPADDAPEAPPRSGAGSGIAAWREFAQRSEVAFPADANRDEIIEACEQAGVI